MNRNPVSDWQELSALYEQADGLTEPALGSLLARLKTERHPMFDQLQRMLSARAQVRSNDFLGALPALHAAPELPAARWLEGSRIGPYRLLRRLGAGGMAEVWLAQRDDGAFQRQVAIKLMFRHADGNGGRDPRDMPRDTFTQRFARERDIVASLHHPHIAALHDAGVTPAGQPWLALEYVEGEPLTAWCDREQACLTQRMRLFRQVLLAVQHAHANLVIHRDLKPANILVTTQGEVRLLDFGIAKLMEPEGGALDETELTRQAGRPLTVQYASPEQVAGRPLTTACDVYSLGVVLYELLCGERPYELKVMSAAMLEQAILDADPREPSRRALADATARARGLAPPALRRALSPELDAIALRCLAKQPEARYSSVDALLADVDRWLGGEAVLARAPGAWYRFGKFALRHRLGVGLGAVAVTALAATATVAVVLGLQARSESARALAARDFMMGMFKQADSDKSRGADLTARELLDRGRDDVMRRLNAQPDLQADLLHGIAGIQTGMQEYAKADVSYEQLAKVYARAGQPRQAALTIAARADNALRMGNDALAQELIDTARNTPGRPRQDPELDASVTTTQAWLASQKGDAQRAKVLFLQAFAHAESAFGPQHLAATDALTGVIQAEANLGEFDAALAAQADLERRLTQSPQVTPREAAAAMVGHADLLYRAGHFREAVTHDQIAVPTCVKALGANDAVCMRLIYNRAASLLRMGSAEEVRTDLPALQALADDASWPDFQGAALLLVFRARAALGEVAAQPGLLDRVRAMAQPSGAQNIDPVRQFQARQLLAELAIRESRWAQADGWLASALAESRPELEKVPGYSITGTTQTLMGIALLARHRPDEALRLLKAGQARHEQVLGAGHPMAAVFLLNQAVAFNQLGKPADALEVIARAQPILLRAFGSEAPIYRRLTRLDAVSRALVASGSVGSSTEDAASLPARGEGRIDASSPVEFFN